MKQIVITKKMTIISFGLFLLNAIALEVGGKILSGYSKLPKLDFRISGYNIADVTQYFNLLGNSGRETYFWLNTLDTPFPFLLAFLVSAIFLLLGKNGILNLYVFYLSQHHFLLWFLTQWRIFQFTNCLADFLC